MGEDGLGAGVDRGAVGLELVERARRGEAFELAAVEQLRVDPRGEIVEDLNGPLASRSATSDSIAFSPTPLSAPSA